MPCPHSIFPWIASLQGFALSPWCQGQGWECPVKSQLRNVPKLEKRCEDVTVPASALGAFPVGHPKGSLGKAQQGPELALVPAGVKQEPLSVTVCLPCCKTCRKQPSLNAIPISHHHLSQLNLPAGSPKGHWPCPWSHPLASPWGEGAQGSSRLGLEGT